MKQTIFMALVVFSVASCTQPGDTATKSVRTDSSAIGTGVNDPSATANSPSGINGDTATPRQEISAGTDSMGASRKNAPGLDQVDTATGRAQHISKSAKATKDSTGRK